MKRRQTSAVRFRQTWDPNNDPFVLQVWRFQSAKNVCFLQSRSDSAGTDSAADQGTFQPLTGSWKILLSTKMRVLRKNSTAPLRRRMEDSLGASSKAISSFLIEIKLNKCFFPLKILFIAKTVLCLPGECKITSEHLKSNSKIKTRRLTKLEARRVQFHVKRKEHLSSRNTKKCMK